MKKDQYFCDRYGKPILITPGDTLLYPMPWKIREKHIVTTIWFQKHSKVEECEFMHDLCNDCMMDFVRWWKDGKAP